MKNSELFAKTGEVIRKSIHLENLISFIISQHHFRVKGTPTTVPGEMRI